MDGSRLFNELSYRLEQGFPAPVTEALLRLTDDSDGLQSAWDMWTEHEHEFPGYNFIEVVREITGGDCHWCDYCDDLVWLADTTSVDGGDMVVCNSCLDRYTFCRNCKEWRTTAYDVVGASETYCERCCDNCCHWCEQCSSWIHDDYEDHNHQCDCEAPLQRFEFPANGDGTVSNDERLTVELPAGTIDERGMQLIHVIVIDAIYITNRTALLNVYEILQQIGPLWQMKSGNFTRRLSSALYKAAKIKLPPEVISEVGNTARAHSSDSGSWHVEFTRDLNQPAEVFWHEESCWWQSYGASRCGLKNWGGIGMRSYDDFGGESDSPNGRVWVQPLNKELYPTHDVLGAHAYVVFNGYGDLDGYLAARIIAHLTGRTYRKVEFTADGMYVNNDKGFLVADSATCSKTERIGWSFDVHNRHDASTLKDLVAA